MLLHNRQKLDNDLGARADHDLTLPLLLSIVDGVKAVIEDGCTSHFGGRFAEVLKILKLTGVELAEEISQGRTVMCGA
jgi:hypothetical protein